MKPRLDPQRDVTSPSELAWSLSSPAHIGFLMCRAFALLSSLSWQSFKPARLSHLTIALTLNPSPTSNFAQAHLFFLPFLLHRSHVFLPSMIPLWYFSGAEICLCLSLLSTKLINDRGKEGLLWVVQRPLGWLGKVQQVGKGPFSTSELPLRIGCCWKVPF